MTGVQTCALPIFLLAYTWKSGFGTPMEIMWAYCQNIMRKNDIFEDNHQLIKIISVNDKEYLSPWVQHHSDIVVPNFHDAFQWIEKNVIR